jgi:hypothetical protein
MRITAVGVDVVHSEDAAARIRRCHGSGVVVEDSLQTPPSLDVDAKWVSVRVDTPSVKKLATSV